MIASHDEQKPGDEAHEQAADESGALVPHDGGDGPGAAEPDVAALIARLHEGEVDAAALSADDRQRCVAHLSDEGFSAAEIAPLVGVSERTVVRDRAILRERGALRPALALGDELMGEFQRLALSSIQRLRRIAQDGRTPPYARLWAEEATTRVYQRFLDTARNLRYFPDAGDRTRHLRLTDPAFARREREENAAFMRRVLTGGPDPKALVGEALKRMKENAPGAER